MGDLIFKNKVIMVTGGCGSIGKEIIKQLIVFEPKEIRIFDNWETGFFKIGLDTSIKADILTYIIGDVRNKEEINSSLKNDWDSIVNNTLIKAKLNRPEDSYMATGGKKGLHTEHLGFILAEMQYLQRSYPDAKW